MARPKKEQVTSATEETKETSEVVEATNAAETTIIPDAELVSTKTNRMNAGAAKDDEIVLLHNKQNGAKNPMYGKAANRMVSKNPDKYEILHNGKGK